VRISAVSFHSALHSPDHRGIGNSWALRDCGPVALGDSTERKKAAGTKSAAMGIAPRTSHFIRSERLASSHSETATQKSDFMTTGSTDETIAIRRLIEDWASAVRTRNIGGVLAHHTDDVVMFDVPPPVPPIERHGRRSSIGRRRETALSRSPSST
jgi:hypothetical protein